MKPIVAIVGSPNVGKSTLFNRLTGARTAIVDDLPGVTRDRLYKDVEWNGYLFTLVDTGGIEFYDRKNSLLEQIKGQVFIAIKEADLIIFVVDGQKGITNIDLEAADIVRKSNKSVLLVVNKIDDPKHFMYTCDFYSLGIGEPIPVSAEQAKNIGDLLDAVIENLPQYEKEEEVDVIKIAIAGRPNVGKSLLVNQLLRDERVIVNSIPGTTRDAVDSYLKYNDDKYLIIDTAGIRKKSKIDFSIERYSVMRSLKAIDRSDVAVLLIDATSGITMQDKKIAGYIHKAGKGVIIAINKWDLIEKTHDTMNLFDKNIRQELSFLQYVPTIYISALSRQRLEKIFPLVDFVVNQANIRVSTSVLNKLIQDIIVMNPPPSKKGKKLKIFYITQSGVKPPTFLIFINDKNLLHFSYKRYIENQLRTLYGFEGNPIRIFARERKA